MIAVWLKVMQRPDMKTVYRNLDYWLNAFSNEHYDIWIYNENIDGLRSLYPNRQIISRQELATKPECKTITELINTTPWIADKWRGACFALSIPYWFLSNKFVWGIDADDLIFESNAPVKEYLSKVEEALFKQTNTPVLSSDIYWCVNKQWSFGITLAERERFKSIIEQALSLPTYQPGWGRNIDFQIHEYLRQKRPDTSPISFTTPHWFEHMGDLKTGLCSRFDVEKKHSACSLYGKRMQYALKEEKCLLIR